MNLSRKEKALVQEALLEFREKFPQAKIIFLAVSGSHIYGTRDEKVDVDIDLRGSFIYPTEEFFKLKKPKLTLEFRKDSVDLSIQEVGKFIQLMLSPNMNFIEHINSPIFVIKSKHVPALQKISQMCLSKNLYAHIQGFNVNMVKHAEKEKWSKPKRILYMYRDLLRGIILFKRKEFESNIFKLAKKFNDKEVIEIIKELIKLKTEGKELNAELKKQVKKAHERLQAEMLKAKECSVLPDRPAINKKFVNDFLIKLRKENLGKTGIPEIPLK